MSKLKGSEQDDGGDEPVNVSSASSSSGKKYRKGQYQPTGKTLKVRLNERDSVTRGEGRARVTMEPAFKSIINVYQLIKKEKLKKGATPVYTTLGKAKSAVVGGISSGSSGSGQKQAPPPKLRESLVWKGYFVDTNNDLALTPAQKKDVKDYPKLNQDHKKDEKPVRDEINMAKYTKEQEEKAAIEAANIASIKTGLESRTAFKSDSPKNLLIKRIKDLRIPLEDNLEKLESRKTYSRRSFGDEKEIEEINRAITAAQEDKRLGTAPAPIIIYTKRANSPTTAMYAYIMNDLSFRRRKTMHTKVKRLLHGNKRKMPLVKGSKRRVVMKKKKGGKR